MSDEVFSAVGKLTAPTAVVDLDAFDANADELLRRAKLPLRVATKSLRVRGLIERVANKPGFAGLLAYSAREAIWLAGHGLTDIVVGYPSVDVEAMAHVSSDEQLASEITFMVDLPEHLELINSAAAGHPLRICLDVDASLRIGGLHLGAHRSSIHTIAETTALARKAHQLPGVKLVGLMFYDAQIAGIPDSSHLVRAMKRVSWRELDDRRRNLRDAVESLAELEFVNAGGTGSVHRFIDDGVVTDVAVGSGLFLPTLFDNYDEKGLRPSAFFGSPITRKPSADVVVVANGGYAASGPAGISRSPQVVHPSGLRVFKDEGFGEVQTPLRGAAASSLKVGDAVWFRHAKAGEMFERFDRVVLVSGGTEVGETPTYRAEGQNFG